MTLVAPERMRGREGVERIGGRVSSDERIKTSRTWKIHAKVEKFHSDDDRWDPDVEPYETVDIPDNLLTNVGIQRLEDLLIGAGGQAFDVTHSRIGVGNSATAAAATDTDLNAAAGAANRQFVLVTSVSRSSQTITWVATFTSGLANFTWAEWGLDPGTANATTVTTPLLNHKVTALGVKVSGAAWVFTVTLVIS